MKISVVIPNYNSGKYLEKSLDSIFGQGYQDLDVIVVDGGSTDNSLEILRRYQGAHSNLLVHTTETEGEVAHINVGMALARGDIVSWLCADDTYEPGCFRAIVEKFWSKPETQWVYGKVKIINETGAEVRGIVTKAKEVLQPRYSYPALQCVCFIAEPSVFMRRNFYLCVGEYDKNLPFTADYDYWLRAGRLSEPVFINEHLANWRAHSGSTSVNNYKRQMIQAYETQKRYSGKGFRPAQWAICQSEIFLYRYLVKK
jgi:GT2 family glycosyltransferase